MAIAPARKFSPRQKKNSLTVEQNLAGRIMVVLSDSKIFPTLTDLSFQPFWHQSATTSVAKIELELPHSLSISLTSRTFNNYSLQAKSRYSESL
jgi:hypothetical protein